MCYQWDLYDFREKLKILASDYQIAKSKDEKEKILEFIDIYQEALRLVTKKTNASNTLLDDSIQCQDFKEFIYEQINSYQVNDTSILNLLLQSYLPFKENYRTNAPLSNVKIVSTNEEIVSSTRDFIHRYIPLSIQKRLDPIFHNPNLLQISYSTSEVSTAGFTLLDVYFGKKYIYLARKNNLLDLGILPHESLHYLIVDFNDLKTQTYNTYYLHEVEGRFADILFGDYFYHYASEFNNYFNQFQLQVYENEISDLVISNLFVDALTEKGRFRMNKFNKALDVYECIPFRNTDEIMNYMTIPMAINMKYALGFLVAIDLFYIYQRDPEFSFYLLENIRYIKEENDILGILRRNHITFMDDDYENLKKYVKKIERQN